MTEDKTKDVSASTIADKSSEESKDSQAAGITVSGISGTKTLRVGRVNKRAKTKIDEGQEQGELKTESSPADKSLLKAEQEKNISKTKPMEDVGDIKIVEDSMKAVKEVKQNTSLKAESTQNTSETTDVKENSQNAKTQAIPASSDHKPEDKEGKSGQEIISKTSVKEDNNTPVTAKPAQPMDAATANKPQPSSVSPTNAGSYSGGSYNNGSRPQGQGGSYNSGPRPQGQGGSYNNGPRPQGQGGSYNSGPRPQGQGGSYNNGPRPQGQGGSYNSGPRPQGQGGSYNSGPRPQGQGGSYNNGPRPQGQGGSYNSGPRPQGQGGSYNNGPRPQGQAGTFNRGPRPQGQGGAPYNNRGRGGFSQDKDEDYTRSKEDNGYNQRNAAKSSSKPKDELGIELAKEKSKFAQRDLHDKNKKDSTKDSKKDPVKKDPLKNALTADRRGGNLKAATAVFSGRGASEILADDTVLDNLFPGQVKNKKGQRKKLGHDKAQAVIPKAVLTHVQLPAFLTIKDFSEGIQKRSADVIKKLMALGIIATLNQEIDFDTATIIASEFNITTEKIVEITEEDILFDDADDLDTDLEVRPPVVVVMGHVDHGKTSLLDKIRSATVVKGEAGGITQHIGAYTVRLKNHRRITFLDTPGHEAFTSMRARGAQVTDIAILVVAADDGVMPQTIEAINHAKAANTEIIIAINKMDKPGANPDRVKQELSLHGILSEDWGGDTVIVPVSAHTGEGIEELLEMVLLTADMMELKSNPHKQAKGTVIEAKLDKNRGPVATLLVQRGTLRAGDSIVTGSTIGRIRAMTDDKGMMVKKAGPSIPVEILGLPEVPEAGDVFYAVTDEKVARQLVEKRRIKQREDQLRKSSRMSLETLSATLASGEVKDLNLIVKADVQGSVEAVTQSLEQLTSDEVRVKVIHGAAGTITESDITLADVSNAIIIGFNVRPSVQITEMAKNVNVDIKLYRVIYAAIEEIEAAMKGLLKPTFEEAILGHIEIRQIFKVSNIGTIGGAYVTDGKVLRSSEVRVVRNGIVVHEGKLASLKRFKDDVKEVNTGYECGISIENYNDILEGDIIEAFEMREVVRK